MVLHSRPNGFSFLFSYELSSVARGKGMFEAGWGKGLERKFGAKSWGALNSSLHSPSSEAAELFPVGRRGGGEGTQHPPSPEPGHHEGRMLVRKAEADKDGERGQM